MLSNSSNNPVKQASFYRLKKKNQKTESKKLVQIIQLVSSKNTWPKSSLLQIPHSFHHSFIHSNNQKQISVVCLPTASPSVGHDVVSNLPEKSLRRSDGGVRRKSVRQHFPLL